MTDGGKRVETATYIAFQHSINIVGNLEAFSLVLSDGLKGNRHENNASARGASSFMFRKVPFSAHSLITCDNLRYNDEGEFAKDMREEQK